MQLLNRIHQQLGNLTKPTLEEVGDALKQISNQSHPDLELYIMEPDKLAYGRNVIYRNDCLEVIVINLPPHKETAIHDHGGSIGCAVVLEGTLLNSIYRINNSQIEPAHSFFVKKGECLYSTLGLIHKMSNSDKDRMISLHVYSPPLQNMSTFKEHGDHPVSLDMR
ncbi:cysteine dioxygenase [Peribacillus deserti]|uniref:Cysteine dioxygenase n=1 Tax=Peribacillus deserti TaxID=673318 RepID=A0ABS2QEL1_9BACI|nr:cysteine dioxygenase family protein [Peribacillus deserti]MBM7691558.1 cysteine dioxygenase [Peribacillus deserti]